MKNKVAMNIAVFLGVLLALSLIGSVVTGNSIFNFFFEEESSGGQEVVESSAVSNPSAPLQDSNEPSAGGQAPIWDQPFASFCEEAVQVHKNFGNLDASGVTVVGQFQEGSHFEPLWRPGVLFYDVSKEEFLGTLWDTPANVEDANPQIEGNIVIFERRDRNTIPNTRSIMYYDLVDGIAGNGNDKGPFPAFASVGSFNEIYQFSQDGLLFKIFTGSFTGEYEWCEFGNLASKSSCEKGTSTPIPHNKNRVGEEVVILEKTSTGLSGIAWYDFFVDRLFENRHGIISSIAGTYSAAPHDQALGIILFVDGLSRGSTDSGSNVNIWLSGKSVRPVTEWKKNVFHQNPQFVDGAENLVAYRVREYERWNSNSKWVDKGVYVSDLLGKVSFHVPGSEGLLSMERLGKNFRHNFAATKHFVAFEKGHNLYTSLCNL